MLTLINDLKKLITEDNLTKILLVIIVIAIIYFYKSNNYIENFNNSETYTSNTNIVDDQYVDMYDNILIDTDKDKYYLDTIINSTKLNKDNFVINIGCKTGNINRLLNDMSISSIGLDRSKKMIDFCKNKYNSDINSMFYTSDYNYIDNINLLNDYNKKPSHILCLNMEIYYIEDLNNFFYKCYNSLDQNGFLIIHTVDHLKFNNTSVYSRINNFNPNSLSIKKINDSVIKFSDVIYNTKYRIFPNDFGNDTVWFTETITTNNNKIYEYIHNYNMISNDEIKNIATTNGFKLYKIINIDLQHYNNEYLYIFIKSF